jgi:hypothetical protein
MGRDPYPLDLRESGVGIHRCIATVAEFSLPNRMRCPHVRRDPCSNPFTFGPVVSHPDRIASAT